MNDFLEKHQNDNAFDKFTNAALYGTSVIANLNVRIDQCLNVLELDVTTSITQQVDDVNRKLDKTAGVDMSLNYRGEKKEILGMRGSKFPFSFGDYATKVMVGSFDKTMNNLDKPPGAGCACIIS